MKTPIHSCLFVLLLAGTLGTDLHLEAQSCSNPTSCPVDNGCSPGSAFTGDCGPAQGSDPVCTTTGNPDRCRYTGNGCPYYSDGTCCYRVSSPIVIDTTNEGFHFSDPAGGVWFHVIRQNPVDYRVAWPVQGSHNGWLVLDRNENGIIDDFGEFFGNLTAQPRPADGTERNGFAALAVFDQPDQGGNSDGWITRDDQIYDKLRIWIDENHDGVSQSPELHTLNSLGVAAVRLSYEFSQLKDANGNLFRYRSMIRDLSGGEANMTIYDVYPQLGAKREDTSTANWFLSPTAPAEIDFHQKR